MKKVAVVYWSGTGNTQAMADAVSDGVRAAGGEAETIDVSAFSASEIGKYDAFAFGCPAMGAENLEESEFQPMWDAVKGTLGTKPVGLFGSYGWGSGEWMEQWKGDAAASGIQLVHTVIANEAPGEDAVNECQDLGRALAG